MIIEICALWLVEDCIIFCYNHLAPLQLYFQSLHSPVGLGEYKSDNCSLHSRAVLTSRAHEWRSHEIYARRVRERAAKPRGEVAPAPISSLFLFLRPPLLLIVPNKNRHATQAMTTGNKSACHWIIPLTLAMFTLYHIAFVLAQKPYQIWLLFLHNSSDFRMISVTEQSCFFYTR